MVASSKFEKKDLLINEDTTNKPIKSVNPEEEEGDKQFFYKQLF